MKTKLLMIGQESVLEKAKGIAMDIPELEITAVADHHPDLEGTLKKMKSSQFDGVAVANPLLLKKEISLILEDVPVFYLKYTPLAFYTTLFKWLFEHADYSPSQCKLSIDTFYEQKIRKQLCEKGIPLKHFKIQEYKPNMEASELLEFHENLIDKEVIHAVMTSHPHVYYSLKSQQINVYLITPTTTCIKDELTKIHAKVRKDLKLKQSQIFPIRYENHPSVLKKLGLSGATIHRLNRLCESIGSNHITAAELATGFSITMRSARRILTTLEDHKVAKVIGEEQTKGRGRPRYVYQIDFKQLSSEQLPAPALG